MIKHEENQKKVYINELVNSYDIDRLKHEMVNCQNIIDHTRADLVNSDAMHVKHMSDDAHEVIVEEENNIEYIRLKLIEMGVDLQNY